MTIDEEAFQLHLLLTSVSAPGAPALPATPRTDSLAALCHIAHGDYLRALGASLDALQLEKHFRAPPETVEEWFNAVHAAAHGVRSGSDTESWRWLTLAAVSSLYVFTQANLTGPVKEDIPESPFDVLPSQSGAAAYSPALCRGGPTAVDKGDCFGRDSTSAADEWASRQLAENGEDLIGRIRFPQYLLLAINVLQIATAAAAASTLQQEGSTEDSRPPPPPPPPPALHWWAARATLLQQRILAGRSAVLRDRLLYLTKQVVHLFVGPDESGKNAHDPPYRQASPLPPLPPASELQRSLAAAALLESAMMETAYGHVGPAKSYTERACTTLGLKAELAGVLGVRTVHQQDPRAQLILNVSVIPCQGDAGDDVCTSVNMQQCGEDGATLDALLLEHGGTADDVKGLVDESDVLRHPKIVSSSGNSSKSGGKKHEKEEEERGGGEDDDSKPSVATENMTVCQLPPLHQAAILAMCLSMKKGAAADGLQPWEVAAYAGAVLQQWRGEFLIRAAAHLHMSRLERQRSRTRERALLTLEGIAYALDNDVSRCNSDALDQGGRSKIGLPSRMKSAFAVWFPMRIALQKELGEALVALGLVGAALPLFESLELWDNLIVCYRLMDKKVAAEQLITRRLEVTPNDPRLWCALGDLSLDDAHYEKAWKLSGGRNARSQRSLARNAMRGERFGDAASHWEIALGLSPLHAEGWFTLGWCLIKVKAYSRALTALTRATQMEPDNGEAWNNLAAVHMNLEHWREAFTCLGEAVKHKRESWQTWENYAAVAAKIGEWQVAIRAVGEVVALSRGERVDVQVLEQLIEVVESGGGGTRGGAENVAASTSHDDQHVDEDEGGESAGAAGVAAALSLEFNTLCRTRTDSCASAATPPAVHPEEKESAGSPSQMVSSKKEEEGEETQRAEEHAPRTLRLLVGNVLKKIASAAAGESSFWALYARYYTAIGEHEAAAECLMKRVRALQSGAGDGDPTTFEAYAAACCALARAYGATGGRRELSQARMLLRAAIRQGAERHRNVPAYSELERALTDVEAKGTGRERA